MNEMLQRILHGGLNRDEARRERRDDQQTALRPRPFLFHFEPEDESFKFRIQFRKSHITREELIATLREILASLEQTSDEADSAVA